MGFGWYGADDEGNDHLGTCEESCEKVCASVCTPDEDGADRQIAEDRRYYVYYWYNSNWYWYNSNRRPYGK